METKTVFITGAAKRLGMAITREIHSHGMNVIIHYKSSATSASILADSLNKTRRNSAFLLEADLLKADNFSSLAKQASNFTGRLDVLINNASMFYPTLVGSTTLAQWQELIGTNMKAPYFLSQACHQYLQKSGGSIINIADIHGVLPLKNHPVYSAGKAGLIMLTKALAKELGPTIRVNAISPGAILWPEGLSDQKKQEILSRTVMKRRGNLLDIANAVRFLILDADYITGQILTIDGGRTLFY